MRRILAATATIIVVFTSCSKSDSDSSAPTSFTFPSNSIVVTDSLLASASTSGSFTFYSFADTAEVANSDSATRDWDFGIQSTNIIVNSASSGPGSAAAQLIDGDYSTLSTIAITGYKVDSSTTNRAIKDGSWYDYNPATRSFTPKAGKTFLFKTANTQKYVKFEMLKADPQVFIAGRPTKYLYKFRYTLQP
jgi:hypothetical protein